jgi:hypothetical protein
MRKERQEGVGEYGQDERHDLDPRSMLVGNDPGPLAAIGGARNRRAAPKVSLLIVESSETPSNKQSVGERAAWHSGHRPQEGSS